MAEVRLILSGDASGAQNALRITTQEMEQYRRETDTATRSSGNLSQAMSYMISAASGLAAGFATSELVKARIELDKITNTMKAATGAGFGSELSFVRGETDRLGLSLSGTALAYARLTAAAQGSALEGEPTRKIFSAVAGAATVMGLSVDETNGILLALNQMMSKGTVQAEELKGQLGERLPGAFNMAASAMGVTTAQLNKMLENGQVMAKDLLPKLADEMTKRFGGQIPEAARSTQAELNRMNTALFEIKTKFMEGDTFASFFRTATVAAKGLGDNLDVVKAGLVGITAGGVIGGIRGLSGAMSGLALSSTVASAAMAPLLAAAGAAAAIGYGIGKFISYANNTNGEQDVARLRAQRSEIEKYNAELDDKIKAQSPKQFDPLSGAESPEAAKKAAAERMKILESEMGYRLAKMKTEMERAKGYSDLTDELVKKSYEDKRYSAQQYYDYVTAKARWEYEITQNFLTEKERGIKEELFMTTELAQQNKLLADLEGVRQERNKAAQDEAKATGQAMIRLQEDQKKAIEDANKALEKRIKDEFDASEEIRKHTEATKLLNLEEQNALGIGTDSFDLRKKEITETSKLIGLQNELAKAQQSAGAKQIAILQTQITAQETLVKRINEEVNLMNRKGELTGAIVGYNGDTPIYADEYQKQQAANRYVTNAELLGTNAAKPSTPPTNGGAYQFNMINSGFSLGTFTLDGTKAAGGPVQPFSTYLVGERGPEILTMGSSGGNITPNSAIGGNTFTGDVHITVNAGTTSDPKQLARQIYGELQQLSTRYR